MIVDRPVLRSDSWTDTFPRTSLDVLSHFAELLSFLVTADVDLKLATDKPLASMYLYEVNVDLTM